MLRLFARRRSLQNESPVASSPVASSPVGPSKVNAQPYAPVHGAAAVEELERRALFTAAPFITTIVPDNRGEVVFTTSRGLNPATVNTASVFLFNVGPDGEPLTADDTKVPIRPIYTESNYQLRIRTVGLPANTTYFVKLSAKLIQAWDGQRLDGEFNGAGVRTGNGNAYGDLLFVSRRDKTTRPVARFYTNYGGVNVSLFKDQTPNTVQNFFNYANKSAWDGTFFHRSVPGFIVQGGGFIANKDNDIDPAVQDAAVVNEPGVSNTRSTIAMAKIGGNPNSATNQWFFNLADNRGDEGDPNDPDDGGLDFQNGGFTAFGEVVLGMDVVDFIAGRSRVNLGEPFSALPINDLAAFQARGNQLDPAADLVSVRRVAILNKIGALTIP